MKTDRLKRYPRYKDSGIEWLGKIPDHWEIVPVSARYEIALGKMLDSKRTSGAFPGPYLRNVDVQWDAINTDALPEMDFLPLERDRYGLRPGDLLVCEGGEVGRTAMWHGEIDPCFYQKALHRVRPRRPSDVPRFFYYLMYAIAMRGVFASIGNQNTIDHLTAVQLKHFRLPFASGGEQLAIATFLDNEIRKIDEVVAKNERLIKLLQEKRALLVTRAVTKGLDTNSPMKHSGVEWLGEIPAHWERVAMWRVSKAVSGGTPAREQRAYWDGNVPWVSPKDMKKRVIDSSEETVTERALEETGIRLVDPPAVLIVVRGMILVHTFPVAITSVPVTINQDMKALRFRPGINPLFMTWLLEGIGREMLPVVVEEAAHGTRAIRMDQWRTVTIALPPEPEQRAIVAYLDRETEKIDLLVSKIRQAVNKLSEFRTSLISAAVTGKIDVREEVT